MAVLKQISPTRVPVAPKDSPSKDLPSSRARSARIGLHCRCCRPIFKCVEASKRSMGEAIASAALISPSTLQRFILSTKNPNRNLDSGF
jgi:hypothetical protein